MYDVHLFHQPSARASGPHPLSTIEPVGDRSSKSFHYYSLPSPPTLRDDPPISGLHTLPPSADSFKPSIDSTSTGSSPNSAAVAGASPLYGYHATSATGNWVPVTSHADHMAPSSDRHGYQTEAATIASQGPYGGMYQQCHPAAAAWYPPPYDVYSTVAHQVSAAAAWTDGCDLRQRSLQTPSVAIYRSFVDANFIRRQHQQPTSISGEHYFGPASFGDEFTQRANHSRLMPEVKAASANVEFRQQQIKGKPEPIRAVSSKMKSNLAIGKHHQVAAARRAPALTGRGHCQSINGFSSSFGTTRLIGRPPLTTGHGSSDSHSMSSVEDNDEDASCAVVMGDRDFQTSQFGASANSESVQTSFNCNYLPMRGNDGLMDVASPGIVIDAIVCCIPVSKQ